MVINEPHMVTGELYKITAERHAPGKHVTFYQLDSIIEYYKKGTKCIWVSAPDNTVSIFLGYKSAFSNRTQWDNILYLFLFENQIRAVIPRNYQFERIYCDYNENR